MEQELGIWTKVGVTGSRLKATDNEILRSTEGKTKE
jgi:hypothetical protein